MPRKPFNKKSTRDNFKTKLSSDQSSLNTMIIQNPLDEGTVMVNTSAVNNVKFMIWRNRFQIAGNESFVDSYSHKFLDNFLVPTLYLLGQEVSGYKVEVTTPQVQRYFNAVSHSLSVLYSYEQLVSYCEDASTVNIGLQKVYNKLITPEIINAISDLKYSLKQHYCPKEFHDYIVDYYTLRQSGDSSESCIIGNTCLNYATSDVAFVLGEINNCIDELQTVSRSDGSASFFTVINKIDNKKDLGWKISEYKSMPSVLTYEPEFIMRIANATKSVEVNGNVTYVPSPVASDFLATTANPSPRAVLEIGITDPIEGSYNDMFLPEFVQGGSNRTNCLTFLNHEILGMDSNDKEHIELLTAGCGAYWTIFSGTIDNYKACYLGGTVIRGYTLLAQKALYNAYCSRLWELDKLQR